MARHPRTTVRRSRFLLALAVPALVAAPAFLDLPGSGAPGAPRAGVALAATATPPIPSALPDALEGFAAYLPQSTCDPIAKEGVIAFRSMTLATYPHTGDYGIVRDCGIGAQSEHKEGRAWDWKVNAYVPGEKQAADAFLAWLLAPDEQGNEAAMARRLGIMYMIWDHKLWGAYSADEGWRPYNGVSPHTDHVHFSFSWPGALKQTSFWTGEFDAAATPASGSGTAAASPAAFGGSAPGASSTAQVSSVRFGDRGELVARVQEVLDLEADGVFGPVTRETVIAFQVDNGLTPDGIVGPRTLEALGLDAAEKTAAPDAATLPTQAAPAPAPVPAPRPAKDSPRESATETSEGLPLRLGSRGPAVQEMQRHLGIAADGVFGPNTLAAVKNFQTSRNLTPDGIVGPLTLAALTSGPTAKPAQATPPQPVRPPVKPPLRPAAKPPAPAASTTTLRLGSRGPAVQEMQRHLGIAADGVFGPNTLAAVKNFQTSRNLTPDGVVGPLTMAALTGSGGGGSTSPTPPSKATTTRTEGPGLVPVAATRSRYPGLLKVGSRGAPVAEAQRKLAISADGVFGSQTEAAVRSFQASQGLSVDGVVGPSTWSALMG